MTAWTQPGFDFDAPAQPSKEAFQCVACGAVEPDLYNMGKHGGIIDTDGYKTCLRMSNTEAILRTYMNLFISPDASHCCAFRYDLGHPRDQEPTTLWRREHYEYAYQETVKTWARASTHFHLDLLEHAMRMGFNLYLTELMFKNSGIPYAQSRDTFEAPSMQVVAQRRWWRDHVGTQVGDLVECTCGLIFTPTNWGYHVAGYPAPTIKESL